MIKNYQEVLGIVTILSGRMQDGEYVVSNLAVPNLQQYKGKCVTIKDGNIVRVYSENIVFNKKNNLFYINENGEWKVQNSNSGQGSSNTQIFGTTNEINVTGTSSPFTIGLATKVKNDVSNLQSNVSTNTQQINNNTLDIKSNTQQINNILQILSNPSVNAKTAIAMYSFESTDPDLSAFTDLSFTTYGNLVAEQLQRDTPENGDVISIKNFSKGDERDCMFFRQQDQWFIEYENIPTQYKLNNLTITKLNNTYSFKITDNSQNEYTASIDLSHYENDNLLTLSSVLNTSKELEISITGSKNTIDATVDLSSLNNKEVTNQTFVLDAGNNLSLTLTQTDNSTITTTVDLSKYENKIYTGTTNEIDISSNNEISISQTITDAITNNTSTIKANGQRLTVLEADVSLNKQSIKDIEDFLAQSSGIANGKVGKAFYAFETTEPEISAFKDATYAEYSDMIFSQFGRYTFEEGDIISVSMVDLSHQQGAIFFYTNSQWVIKDEIEVFSMVSQVDFNQTNSELTIKSVDNFGNESEVSTTIGNTAFAGKNVNVVNSLSKTDPTINTPNLQLNYQSINSDTGSTSNSSLSYNLAPFIPDINQSIDGSFNNTNQTIDLTLTGSRSNTLSTSIDVSPLINPTIPNIVEDQQIYKTIMQGVYYISSWVNSDTEIDVSIPNTKYGKADSNITYFVDDKQNIYSEESAIVVSSNSEIFIWQKSNNTWKQLDLSPPNDTNNYGIITITSFIAMWDDTLLNPNNTPKFYALISKNQIYMTLQNQKVIIEESICQTNLTPQEIYVYSDDAGYWVSLSSYSSNQAIFSTIKGLRLTRTLKESDYHNLSNILPLSDQQKIEVIPNPTSNEIAVIVERANGTYSIKHIYDIVDPVYFYSGITRAYIWKDNFQMWFRRDVIEKIESGFFFSYLTNEQRELAGFLPECHLDNIIVPETTTPFSPSLVYSVDAYTYDQKYNATNQRDISNFLRPDLQQTYSSVILSNDSYIQYSFDKGLFVNYSFTLTARNYQDSFGKTNQFQQLIHNGEVICMGFLDTADGNTHCELGYNTFYTPILDNNPPQSFLGFFVIRNQPLIKMIYWDHLGNIAYTETFFATKALIQRKDSTGPTDKIMGISYSGVYVTGEYNLSWSIPSSETAFVSRAYEGGCILFSNYSTTYNRQKNITDTMIGNYKPFLKEIYYQQVPY